MGEPENAAVGLMDAFSTVYTDDRDFYSENCTITAVVLLRPAEPVPLDPFTASVLARADTETVRTPAGNIVLLLDAKLPQDGPVVVSDVRPVRDRFDALTGAVYPHRRKLPAYRPGDPRQNILLYRLDCLPDGLDGSAPYMAAGGRTRREGPGAKRFVLWLSALLTGQDGGDKFTAPLAPDEQEYLENDVEPLYWKINDGAKLEAGAEPNVGADVGTATPSFTGAFSAAALAAADLPPVRWAVNGLLPVGLALLVAAPKLGKSWAALDLCMAVAAGRPWLGCETVKGPALYLALEDSPQRLQDRMQKIGGGFIEAPADCFFQLQAPDLAHGLLDDLTNWRKYHDAARLICVDTFQRIRPPAPKNENAYAADYRVCAELQRWAMQNGVCLLMLHHTKKGAEPGDVFASISGSTGIFGAADAVLTITKKRRFDQTACLSVTGRDVNQTELTVEFDKGLFRWNVLGTVEDTEKEDELRAFEKDPVARACEAAVHFTEGSRWSGTLDDLVNLAADHHIEVPFEGVRLGRRLSALGYLLRTQDGIVHTSRMTNGRRVHTLYKLEKT